MSKNSVDSVFLLVKNQKQATDFLHTYDGLFKHINNILLEHEDYYADLLFATRLAIKRAYDNSWDNVLILSNNPVLAKDKWHYFEKATQYIEDFNLDALYLGVYRHASYDASLIDNNLTLLLGGYTTCNAVIYNKRMYQLILDSIPETYEGCIEWCKKYAYLDQWLASIKDKYKAGCINPELEITYSEHNEKTKGPYSTNAVEEYGHIKAIHTQGNKERAYVVFTELQLYFIWQVELFIHSLINNAKVDSQSIVVLYSGVLPTELPEHNVNYKRFMEMINKYNVNCIKVDNVGKMGWYFRLNSEKIYTKAYAGANKWTSLVEASNRGIFKKYNEVVLLEQDLWFDAEFPELPKGNVATSNWINNKEKAFANNDLKYPGLNLTNVLKACNVSEHNISLWGNGSIIFKFDNATINDKRFLKKIIDYTQLILVMGEITHPEGARHETDMISPNLAFADCGIPITIVNDDRLKSDTWCAEAEAPEGIVVHYGWDFTKMNHKDVEFSKFGYTKETPWDNLDNIKKLIKKSKYKWMKKFFGDMLTIGQSAK